MHSAKSKDDSCSESNWKWVIGICSTSPSKLMVCFWREPPAVGPTAQSDGRIRSMCSTELCLTLWFQAHVTRLKQ